MKGSGDGQRDKRMLHGTVLLCRLALTTDSFRATHYRTTMRFKILTGAILAAAAPAFAKTTSPAITGDYLECARATCTSPCFANAEMGLTGKECILVWKVRQGLWRGTSLNGLGIIAVIRTDDTLGDRRYQPRTGKAVLIVDVKAGAQQRVALADLAKTMAGTLISEVSEVKTSVIDMTVGGCSKAGCASVKASGLVSIATRCFGDKDHVCGNEETFYPPLTDVTAIPAFTELASYNGSGLGLTWQSIGTRSAFLGSFTQ